MGLPPSWNRKKNAMILYIPETGFGGAASLGQGSLGPEVTWANLKYGRTCFLNKIYYVRRIAA